MPLALTVRMVAPSPTRVVDSTMAAMAAGAVLLSPDPIPPRLGKAEMVAMVAAVVAAVAPLPARSSLAGLPMVALVVRAARGPKAAPVASFCTFKG